MLSKMKVTIGDKTIEAKIMDIERAEKKYEDAVAGGHTAAILRESNDNVDLHQLDIGNILPG